MIGNVLAWRFMDDQSGAAAVEYRPIVVLIITALADGGTNLEQTCTKVDAALPSS
jgi:Flp pilus assembly pilin Flp